MIDASENHFLELFKNELTPMAQTATNMGFAPWINTPVYG